MDLKPINSYEPITFLNTTRFNKPKFKKGKKIIEDPQSVIPNGIFGVIKWEIRKQIFAMISSLIILLLSVILIIMYAKVWNMGPVVYLLPISFGLFSLYILLISKIEYADIKRSVSRYREDLKVGLTSTPPFISKLYINFYKKQISHNWLTFAMIFYGGILTLVIWELRNVNWWLLNFHKWIKDGLGNPNIVVTLLSITLLSIVLLHIFFAIMRRKKIADINMYFGSDMASESQIEEIKNVRNKFYRRIFIISLLVILVIPMAAKFIWKVFRRKS